MIFPAIDLRGGRCVRLVQGDFERETVYGDDPVAMAKHWQSAGARMLHIVDLDGAKSGGPCQTKIVARIAAELDVPIQVGGGIRSADDAALVLDAGVSRVIIGTAAVENPELVRQLLESFGPEQIVIGVDARNGNVATRGWLETSEVKAGELIGELASRGVRTVIYTDIERDGTLASPNFEATKAVANVGVDIIASGGVGSLSDLVRLSNTSGVVGAIVGRALYTGDISFTEIDGALRAEPAKGGNS